MEMEQAMYNHSLEILGNQQAMEILEMEMEQAMETQQSLKSTELTKARLIMDEESASETRFTVDTSCRAPSSFWPPAAGGLIHASTAQGSRLISPTHSVPSSP